MSGPQSHVESLTNMSKAKAFLGREFLTWLWYMAETNEERLQAPGRVTGTLDFDIWVDDRIVLEASSGMSHSNVMKGGDPSQSFEAAAALTTGKTVKEMKLGVNVKNYGEYTAVLHCDELNPRSLKLPKPDAEGGAPVGADELPIVWRLKHTEVFLAVLDGLFARFLNLRVDETWQATGLVAMRAWIKQRHKGTDSGTLH
jgi:hypothetical protein